MHTKTVLIIPSALALASIACADLPRSLSFENQTGARINTSQSEGSSNEKEVEFGDLNNDGWLDMVIGVGSSDFGERKNKLYINNAGVFDEMSGSSLIPEFAQADVSRNAFIRDFDGDGWNDIYIINDSNSGGFAGTDKLYLAQHSGGVLTGYSEEGGSRIPLGGALGAACGGVSFDFDGDGDMDVYSGNYPGPSQDRGLYYNAKTGNLDDLSGSFVPLDSDYTVDIALGDMNGDGKMDLLVSNWSVNYIYYNDNNDDGTQLGDYRYSGSTQALGNGASNENAMEAADFDGDGDLDIYWSGMASGDGDRILRNDGNDAFNKATFTTLNILPTSVTSITTRKASIADFNDDGRVDVFVAGQTGNRPAVLRNTSVNGTISFVDWTPNPAFPNSSALRGWHGAAFDTNNDGDADIVMGGFNGDHLLENVRANEVTEAAIAGVLPSFFSGEPVAVLGIGSTDAADHYVANGVGSGFVSVVLNGPDDYLLEVRDSGGALIASADRGGLGIEEALQVNTASGLHTISVTVLAAASAGNPADFDNNGTIDFNDLVGLLAEWGCTDCIYDIDGGGAGFSELLMVLGSWGDVVAVDNEYLLEVLGR